MNDYIDEFRAGNIWIHIRKDQFEYVEELIKIAPDIKFCSGDKLNSKVMNNALYNGEAWFRYYMGVSYCTTNPRVANTWELAPKLYREGEIVNIADIVKDNQVVVTEDELISLLG